MKLDKDIIQRRINLMTAEGIVCIFAIAAQLLLNHFQTFVPNIHVGVDVDVNRFRNEHDAVVICTGATWPRDLKIPHRDANGIHFAMEYLQVGLIPSPGFVSYRKFY